MPFARPTLTELIKRVTSDIASRLVSQAGSVLRRSLIGILGRVYAGAVHLLYGYLDWIARQAIPDTAESEYLERWAAIWKITRRPATFAVGPVEVTANAPITLLAGTMFQRQDGAQYASLVDVDLVAGTNAVDLLAVEPGAAANTPAGISLTLLSPVAGVQSTATILGDGIRSGTDVEDDASLCERLLARIQQPPQGGAVSDYVAWAKEVPGVTRVWVYPMQMGPGTVTVMFTTDDDPISPIPDAATVAEVQAHIDEERPVTATVYVVAPVGDPLNFTIKLSPNTASVRAAVTAELSDLLLREAEPGGTILISHIREAVSIAAGEVDNQVIAPAADVVSPQGHMSLMGTITFQSLQEGSDGAFGR
ncbi:baseplate J/gp47 family protein [Pseudomonas schmalbachii]|uniref:Baseplate J/gp47 family protein n=1 Tax=Pseudomonas schmalbachii TaxID=2816993 RepID=A0ABS3TKF0_9PSED|nr:baseplate J/gp47 family protein [Pseudomonas schmalbachii]MBO3274120.1 baseplate J/gp47 family protein [Pseudomonas schmalbachii]